MKKKITQRTLGKIPPEVQEEIRQTLEQLADPLPCNRIPSIITMNQVSAGKEKRQDSVERRENQQ